MRSRSTSATQVSSKAQPTFDAPDPTTLGILSLLVGIGYLVIGRLLDRSDRHGTATPFTVVTLPALVTGVVLLFEDLELAGTGLLTIVLGAALAFHGATVGRRFTTWVGCGSIALGAALFLGDMSDDPTVLGMLFIAAGIALVAGGYAVAAVLDEPDELAPGASVFVRPERKVSPPAAPSGWGPPLAGPPPAGGTTWGQPPQQPPPGPFGPPPAAPPSFAPPTPAPPARGAASHCANRPVDRRALRRTTTRRTTAAAASPAASPTLTNRPTCDSQRHARSTNVAGLKGSSGPTI